MKKRKTAAEGFRGKVSRLLDVPLDMVADVPRIILYDNSELTIENYKAVESYTSENIELRCTQYRIVVKGNHLSIIAITDEEILIQGHILNVSLT